LLGIKVDADQAEAREHLSMSLCDAMCAIVLDIDASV